MNSMENETQWKSLFGIRCNLLDPLEPNGFNWNPLKPNGTQWNLVVNQRKPHCKLAQSNATLNIERIPVRSGAMCSEDVQCLADHDVPLSQAITTLNFVILN